MKFARALILPALGTVVLLFGMMVPANAGLSRVPTAAPEATASSGAAFEDEVMVEINGARVRAGLKPVRFFDSCVDRLATAWGKRIATTGVFAHRDQQQILRKCDQQWAGETLIRGSDLSPRAIVDAWLASPPHRAVLLKVRASRAGLAVVLDGRGRQVGVLNFADNH